MECIIQARARVKERYQNIRANVLYTRLDPKGRGRIQISAELPLIYATGRRTELQLSNGPHFSADLRPPRLRFSRPTNQRLASVAPNSRRSLSRRSAFLRNLHEQTVGIVQPYKGRRGASRNR
jgi:hypothetical protein